MYMRSLPYDNGTCVWARGIRRGCFGVGQSADVMVPQNNGLTRAFVRPLILHVQLACECVCVCLFERMYVCLCVHGSCRLVMQAYGECSLHAVGLACVHACRHAILSALNSGQTQAGSL